MLILTVTAGVAVARGGSWRWSWVLVLFAFALGVILAEEPVSAGLHWVGLAFLMIAVGPVIMNPRVIEVRAAAWRLAVNGLTTLTGAFVIWYALHLPNLGGQVYFTAFMNQSMLLGPIAGMGVLIAAARALHGRSWRWGVLAVLGLVPLLASGSRLAALATCAAGCFFLIRRKPVLGIGGALLVSLAVVSFLRNGGDTDAGDSVKFTNALAKKGTENSRAELWQSRIDEFKSSPLVGIGIAMGSGNGAGKDDSGRIRVEPGSSYLAILSMTGGLGFITFFAAIGMLLFQFVGASLPPLKKDILSVVGIYLAVHGVAEGWILGFGHPFCFLFWLWLGSVGDAGRQPVRSVVGRRLRPQHPVRTWKPAPAILCRDATTGF